MSNLPFALLAIVAMAAPACAAPSVDLPSGNESITSDVVASDLSAPSIPATPKRYPYAKLAIRGSAANSVRVLVEGAGNPRIASVQPIDGSFCVVVDLAAAPVHYTLEVRSQAGDGRISPKTIIEVDRANNAPEPADAKLCDDSPAAGR